MLDHDFEAAYRRAVARCCGQPGLSFLDGNSTLWIALVVWVGGDFLGIILFSSLIVDHSFSHVHTNLGESQSR